MKNKLLWLAVLLCLTSIRASATIVYVDSANFAGNQDGTTWASAYYSFAYGVEYANSGDTIWVAKGTYQPIAGTYFKLKKDVKIYGGFKNTDTMFSQRNISVNLTRLKGNGTTIIRNDSALLITNSTILDGFTISNSSPGCGMVNIAASPTITNCIFINNIVSGLSNGGGAMSNSGSNPYIGYCTFSNNSAPIFYGNPPNASGSGGGGAMVNRFSSPTIYRCTFSSNSSTRGGAIFNEYNSNPAISYSSFNNNSVSSVSINPKGGAIYNGVGSTVSLDSCIFINNNGGYYGGGIYNDSVPSSIITRCVFSSNRASFGGAAIHNRYTGASSVDSCYFRWNTSSNGSAGIYLDHNPLLITNSKFVGNENTTCIYALDNSPLTATNCLFSGNEAGAIIITNCQGSLSSISNCRFENDEAFTLGWTDAKTSVNQCQFEGNGGSIYINANLPDTLSSVTNCSFTGNGSTSYGPGIAISYASPLISNCTFTSNVGSTTASGTGGAIYINSFGTQIAAPTITQCSFTGNSAYRGGAIYNTEYSAANISNCTFSNNSATNHGGAIWGPVAKIKNCNFSGNSSLRYGGALYNAAYPVENSIFISNSARTGGGIYSNSSLTSVVNCVFSRNEADSFGGGMYNSAPPAFVTNCTFFGNKANVLGGPIYNTNYGNYNDSTFTNCIIWGNGSGIYNQNTAATAFSYSLVQGLGTFAAKHIIGGTVNPQFIDTAASNFHLLPSSPCIDQGKNSYIPAGIITDLDNGPRIMNSIVDFGAFEFGNIPLGMDLLHFSGKMLHNSSVLLDWQMNNDKPIHTTLQRSRDGKNYTSIYSIRTNPGLNNQSYVDEQPLNENYYRLEITDEQGTLHYSNTIFARLNASLVSTVIYPNPAKESIHLVTKATELLNSTAIITDLTGKVMLRINIASTDQLISLADLPQGIYLLRLANGTIFKISKQ